jgi:hypothetical protein
MKTLIAGAALLAAAIPALAQTNVSISVGQPGFYGRIDLGDGGRPPVVYEQPVVVEQPRFYQAAPAPVYLRVPEGHRKHWNHWCGHYNACGQRVFFVQDNWYTNTYAPRYHREHYREPERREFFDRGPERHEYREERREERGERGDHDRGDHDRGHGEGHGHGHGHGHDRD